MITIPQNCEPLKQEPAVDCRSSIPFSAAATMAKKCNALGSDYTYDSCILSKCAVGYYSFQNSCLPQVCTPDQQVAAVDCKSEIPFSLVASRTQKCNSSGADFNYTPCVATSCDTSAGYVLKNGTCVPLTVDIVAIYEGSGNHYTTTNVSVRVPDTSMVLSLSSYESVNWQITGGANLKRIVLSGYKRQTASHSTNATVTSYCYEGGCSSPNYPSALSSYSAVSGCNGGWFYNMSCPQKVSLLNWLKTSVLNVQNLSIRAEQGAYTAPSGGFNLP